MLFMTIVPIFKGCVEHHKKRIDVKCHIYMPKRPTAEKMSKTNLNISRDFFPPTKASAGRLLCNKSR